MIAYLPTENGHIALPRVDLVERTADYLYVYLSSGAIKTISNKEDRRSFETAWQRFMLMNLSEVAQ